MNVRHWSCRYTQPVEEPVDTTPDPDDDGYVPPVEEDQDPDDDDPDPDDDVPLADDQPGEDPPTEEPAEG